MHFKESWTMLVKYFKLSQMSHYTASSLKNLKTILTPKYSFI